MALRDIKQKIGSVKKTAKVTKAMESVSAVKMRRAQEEALAARVYTHAAFNILKRLAKVSKQELDTLYDFHKKDNGKTAIVLVTASKGLAGALNANVFKKCRTTITEQGLSPENAAFICIGKKGADFAKRNGYEVLFECPSYEADNISETIHEVLRLCLDLFHNQDYKQVLSIYTNFITTTEQYAVGRQILPIKYEDLATFITEVIPARGKFSDIKDDDLAEQVDLSLQYQYEPEPEVLIADLVPQLLHIGLYYSILESKASEHSARMVAMKNATDKAGDVARDLNLVYNKARQAAITREISEIVGGMETV